MATLGCSEQIEVFVADRTGFGYTVEIPHTKVTWARELDETSDATVEVGEAAGEAIADCCADLAAGDVDAWSHELVILRNGGRIWAGPITELEYADSGVKISADDVSAWFAERRIHENHDYRSADLSVIFAGFVEDAMSVDNVPGVVTRVSPSGVFGNRTVSSQMFRMADKELDELASSGVDWTVIDREVIVTGEASVEDATVTLTDGHFVKPGAIKVLGNVTTDQTFIGTSNSDEGATVYGVATQSERVLVDRYGVHEKVTTQDQIGDAQSATQAAQQRIDLFRSPPATFDGGTLDPEAPVSVDDLVPGMLVHVHLQDRCRPIDDNYVLTKVEGTHDADTDEISVTLTPVGGDVE